MCLQVELGEEKKWSQAPAWRRMCLQAELGEKKWSQAGAFDYNFITNIVFFRKIKSANIKLA
jgi:AMMECR1 domain-containing protein